MTNTVYEAKVRVDEGKYFILVKSKAFLHGMSITDSSNRQTRHVRIVLSVSNLISFSRYVPFKWQSNYIIITRNLVCPFQYNDF